MSEKTEVLHGELSQITVLMVTYNSAHCLALQANFLSSFAHVLIVDNGSADPLTAEVNLHVPHAQIFPLEANRGFGAANNLGIAQIKTPYALLLNPDCSMGTEDVQQLLKAAQTFADHVIYAPQIYKSDRSKELSYRMPATYWSAAAPAADAVCCVGFATAAAWLVDVELFKKLNGFDENIFLYYEDEDFCIRAYAAQCAAVIVPQACATHQSRASTKEGFPWRSEYIRGYHHAQSKIYFTHKHLSVQQANSQRWLVLVLALLTLPLRLLWPQPRYLVRLWGRICGLIQWSGHPVHAQKV